MALIQKVAFKALTRNDFYCINRAGSSSGGLESYIDFNTSQISIAEWEAFFAGSASRSLRKKGPAWTFSVGSLGTDKVQTKALLYQRRKTTVSVSSQKLPELSSKGKRFYAWRPENTDFPKMPADIGEAGAVPDHLVENLRVFLVRDDANRFWAGWLNKVPPGISDPRLLRIFNEHAGMIDVDGDYAIDPASPHWPFAPLLDGPLWDESDVVPEAEAEPNIGYSWKKIYKRNRAAAAEVRALYDSCQLTGKSHLFLKRNGETYLEVHHLVPLGKGGADLPRNMVVLSAHAHKMLHYADVSPIDLTAIQNDQLPITINGSPYTITWHKQHSARVLAHHQP